MSANSLYYIGVENDLDQARWRLAELGLMGRLQVVKILAEDIETPSSTSLYQEAKILTCRHTGALVSIT
jgi:hypothetical protein